VHIQNRCTLTQAAVNIASQLGDPIVQPVDLLAMQYRSAAETRDCPSIGPHRWINYF
tara:strand:- start:310 stop:480 length:171 start_codon:yes stop_codon:yes gene_type:complete